MIRLADNWARKVRMPYLMGLALTAAAAAAWTYGLVVGLYLAGSGVVGYAIFCRLVVISHRTWMPIRAAFFAVGCVVVAGVCGALVWGHEPGFLELALLWSLAGLLVAASRRWRNGVPDEFDTDRIALERAGSL